MKTYFFHVMKTGGRSIICSFLAYFLGYRDIVITDSMIVKKLWDQYQLSCKQMIRFGETEFYGHYVPRKNRFDMFKSNNFFGVSHDENPTIKTATENFTTFTCLRHPVHRLVSRYKEALFTKKSLHYHNNTSIHSDLTKYLGNNIVDFANNIGPKIRSEQLRFFSPTLDIEKAITTICKLDKILFTESLFTDLIDLSKILNIHLPYVHVGRTGGNNSEFITESELIEIRTLLKDDIEFYDRIKILQLLKRSHING